MALVKNFGGCVENSSAVVKRFDVIASKVLKGSAIFWFLVAVVGQWIFAFYVMAFYGGSALRGNMEVWNSKFPHGYIAGETMGNTAIAMHLLLAVIITVGGPLQLIPKIRSQFPRFHHWNGRIYFLSLLLTCLAGLYMVWIRGGTVGGFIQHLGISFDALLIIIFAGLTLRYAIARNIKTHRRWALRLFMVVNAVWFFRVGLMLWLMIFQAPVGFDPKTFEGPLLNFLGIADYLIPLAVLELYFFAQTNAGIKGRFTIAISLILLTMAMGVGIVGATMGLWLPYI
jgi:hypothetical protein